MGSSRTFSTSKSSPSSLAVLHPSGKRLAQVGLLGTSLGAGQYLLGTAQDFFDEKFVTTKNPEDLADFYGTEDFMEVFCVLPFMVNLMMRAAKFDDDGTIHSFGLLGPGELEISIDFDEKEADTTGDGEPDTLVWFNKKEHFRDVAPSFLGGFTLWEMTQNFGYHRYDDGTCVVYHHGERFQGFFLVRLIFQLHAKYVIWATEKYINSDAFGSDCDRHEVLEEQRRNIPKHVFKTFLTNLLRDVEQTKQESKADVKKQQELSVVLRRLETIVNDMDDEKRQTELPRLRTLRSHKTRVTQVHLVVDDKEMKETIQEAMRHVGTTQRQRTGPANNMSELVRRTTLNSDHGQEADSM